MGMDTTFERKGMVRVSGRTGRMELVDFGLTLTYHARFT
jgi:hypothetical protein